MTRLKGSAAVFLGLSLALLSIYEGVVGAATCYRERHMYEGAVCAVDMGLGGTDNTTVATGAECAAFCDGGCHQLCSDDGSYCSFVYENCTY